MPNSTHPQDVTSFVPRLNTARLQLLPPDPEHASLYRAFYTDAPASASYGGPLSIPQADARLARDAAAWARQGFGVWVVTWRETGKAIGTCGFWQGDGWPRELTWWLLPAARGQGVALEASRAVIACALEQWRWPYVETYMTDDNAPARALAERLGGVPIDRFVFPDGVIRDLYRLATRP
jgi:RimJ/RimL family protein N-acetyltransferase